MKVGFDIDGVLAPDFDLSSSPNLEKAVDIMILARRMMLPLWNPLPVCKELGHDVVFITSRPCTDSEDTKRFLACLDGDYYSLRTRVDNNILSTKEAALFKTQTILFEHIRVFIESCPKQAELIRLGTQLSGVRVYTFQQIALTGLTNILRSSCST